MLKLHGFAVSNYYNMVKLALLEKGIPFDEVPMIPGKTLDLLSKSPRGKVPALETAEGFISETGVILDYLEDTQAGAPLLPAHAFERAQVRALMREIELYIELPARQCFGLAFFGKTLAQPIREQAWVELKAGIAALGRHGRFEPYVAGAHFTLADIVFLYALGPALDVGTKVFDTDLLAELPAARELYERLQENPNVQHIAADRAAMLPGFLAMMQAKG